MGKELKIKKIDPSQIKYEPVEGELIQTPDGKYMIWHDSQWNEFQMENSGIKMELYDMNKQIIAQLPDLADWDRVEEVVNTFDTNWQNTYYMMYGKEISYFTVFKIKEPNGFGREFIDVVKNVGIIKSIDLTEAADAIEIWVIYNNEPTCLYLFPYDMGIVQVGE